MFFALNLALRFLVNPIAAAGFLKFQDINIVLALALIWSATFINMAITYFAIGTLAKKFIKSVFSWFTRKTLRRMQAGAAPKKGEAGHILKRPKALWGILKSIFGKWSLKRWLAQRSVWILYILLLLPIPYLASVVTVATKMREDMNGRKKAYVLISANFLKGVLVVLSIYYFPILITWHN